MGLHYSANVSMTARTSMTCRPGISSARSANWPRPAFRRRRPSRSGRKSFTYDSARRTWSKAAPSGSRRCWRAESTRWRFA